MIRTATALAMALSILVCIPLALAPAHAAEAPPEPADERQQKKTDEPANAQDSERTGETETFPANSNRTKQRNGAEVFIPSEEISEDFAVSFPVDI